MSRGKAKRSRDETRISCCTVVSGRAKGGAGCDVYNRQGRDQARDPKKEL